MRRPLTALLAFCALPAMAQEPVPSPPNIILVALDTTRADHLSAYGYARDTSPNLQRLAREAVLFERCYSQSNETLTSFASAFTSRMPSELGHLSYERFRVPDSAHNLPGLLALYGYQTGGFVAGGHMVADFGHGLGFDTYQDDWHFGSLHHTIPPALAWLDQRDPQRPFFLFVHGYDAHSPYAKPLYFENMFDPDYSGPADAILGAPAPIEVEKVWQGRYYRGVRRQHVTRALEDGDIQVLHTDLFSLLALQDPATGEPLAQRDLDHFVAHYDGSVAYADLQLGLLLAELEQRGLLDRSVLVVMGDHGEDLFEHGHANHRISLHDASGHVPLLIRFPGGEHGGARVAAQVELLDLLPTLAELAGATPPAEARGRSLLPLVLIGADPQRSGVTTSEGILPMASVRSDTHRLIVSGHLPGSTSFLALLDQGSLDDPAFSLFRVGPGVEEPVSLASPQGRGLGQPLLEALRAAYAEHERIDDAQAPYLDPELQRIMREKGYW
jgi:arylsulfatase A-like enzyme